MIADCNVCRDTEFDLEYDEWRCLQGYEPEEDTSSGKDVQRVTEIFDKPVFFPQGGAANSTAIKQGSLGDCYFLSALATVSGLPGLMEKICVAVRSDRRSLEISFLTLHFKAR